MLRIWTLCLALSTLIASSIPTMAEPNPSARRVRAQLGEVSVLTSSGTTTGGLASRETAGPDTFALYGGPDHPTEGKFQLANGVTKDWGGGNGLPGGYGGGPDAWRPVDLTDEGASFWHVDTFNAANLNSNGVGNRAMWCGIGPGDPRGVDFVTLPGYGHSWNTWLIYESAPIADPATGQTVNLEFYFNFEHEPGYGDKFLVEYDSAGTWVEVLDTNAIGTNKTPEGEFLEPGELFSVFSTRTIHYDGWDYGGYDDDQIVIRLRFTSDGAWDPEDGLWPTDAGAVQLDDITLTTSQGSFTEDFEGSEPYLFEPELRPKAGDFADVYPRLTDLDPCLENTTPLAGFIDYGQIVRNGPGHTGMVTGGGSTSPGIEYGIPGNWVVNYTGGISDGLRSLTNEIWSPEIEWDLPGPLDDAQEIVGAKIRWTTWTHLPLINGIFFVWSVRSTSNGHSFSPWNDRNFVYYQGGVPVWLNNEEDVTDLVYSDPLRVQMALGVIDYANVFGFPGTRSTPAPCFDNAAFYKYRVGGPAFAARTIDLAQDGFPVSGAIDVSTQAGRDALDIPFSMARDVNTGDTFNTPGDSVIVDVVSHIDGNVEDLRMVWALQTNPLFEDAIRSAPARSTDESVVAGPAGSVWSGEVVGTMSSTSAGSVVEDRFFMDLPDVDFMYPGDVLHYYFQAADYSGNVSTLPADITGFGDFSGGSAYSQVFTVRGLPSIRDTAGAQPEILVVNDFGLSQGTDAFHYDLIARDLRSLGYAEGVEFDSYTVMGASSAVSNGIGSAYAHGATPSQLGGYHHILYRSGTVASALLCNGSNTGNNDKGDDVGLMEAWHALAGTRNVVYFGDNVAACLSSNSAEALGYLTNTMAVDQLSQCGGYYSQNCGGVRDVIGGQTAPIVTPAPAYAGSFSTDFVAYGGCPTLNAFDHIQPLGSAQAGHYFTDVSGNPITDPTSGVASVINDTGNGLVMTVPIATFFIQDVVGRGTGPSARAQLVGEILGLFEAGAGGSPIVAAPSPAGVLLGASPNPFNPTTLVKFTAVPGSRGFVKVFNLRGELVRTLHSGEFATQEFRWDGTDTRGAPVSSGVYLIRATDGATTQSQKVALVK